MRGGAQGLSRAVELQHDSTLAIVRLLRLLAAIAHQVSTLG
jgi:hypothetical protein